MVKNLNDFTKAPNQGDNPGIYEVENNAIDHEGNLASALSALAPWGQRTLLDLGCGTGFWLPTYRTDTGTVIGVEPDERLLDTARSRCEEIRVLHGSAEHIPVADASVDIVHARFAYFFPSDSNDCSAGLAEVLRVLKPGGSLVVIDNDHLHGDFAQLMARSAWAPDQGENEYIQSWWAARGAERYEVMSSWTFESASDLGAVLRIEFPTELAESWLAEQPNILRLSYGYALYHVRKPSITDF